MKLAQTLATLSAAHTTEAPIAPVVAVAPSVSFKFGPSYEPRMQKVLVADIYAVKAPGYVDALFSSLEAAGIQYRAPEMKMLIKIYPVGGGVKVNIRTIGHELSRIDGESITGWLDRVAFDERTKAIGIELAASCLTPEQVKHLHTNCTPPKFDDGSTAKLVSMLTFVAPPNLAPEAKQFKRTVAPIEHVESVPLPVLRVPAGHVEPDAPIDHVEFVGDEPVADDYRDESSYQYDSPESLEADRAGIAAGILRDKLYNEQLIQAEFPVEPLIPIEEAVVDSSATIIEIDSLEARTLRELGLLWKSEFGYNVPSKIRHADLCLLIQAKRDSSF